MDIPPVLGTALSYVMGINGPAATHVFVEMIRHQEEAVYASIAGAVAAGKRSAIC